MDTHAAFAFYESIRHRLPVVSSDLVTDASHHTNPSNTHKPRSVDHILDVAEHIDVFVFDAYGVLNVGSDVIPGAVEQINRLRALGKSLYILTNGSSLALDRVGRKFDRMGYDFNDSHIVSSRYCTEQSVLAHDRAFFEKHQRRMLWGAIIGKSSTIDDLPVQAIALTDSPSDYDRVDGFVFLSSGTWSESRHAILESAVMRAKEPRPFIVGNPDVVAPDGGYLSLEPGLFSHRLINTTGISVEFHGKPFPSVFDEVRRRMGPDVPSKRIAMVGDTLHTDIIGGAAAGWSTVLVTDHGLFKGHDVLPFIEQSGYSPDWIIPSL